jgi:UPF0755 protein
MGQFFRTRLLRILTLLIVLLAMGIAGAVFAFNRYLDTPLSLNAPTIVEIPAGTSLNRIANDLEARGYLRWPHMFVAWVRWQEQDRAIRTGEYALSPGLTPRSLLAVLVSGRNVQYPLTLIEGWTARQALTAIWEQETVQPTLLELSDEEIHALLESSLPALEGALFPDTYFHTRGTTDLAILRRAAQRLDQVLNEEWQARAVGLPYESAWEALIMASIIERESGYVDEKQDIAGVFIRRLQTGMRLQSDPTVIYGMGDSYEGVIRRSDLNTTTPYNTYRISGLPPTPIALSGRDSIRASLQPRDGTALYFVSRGDGTHQFSDTLEEHNAAVRRYLRGENE